MRVKHEPTAATMAGIYRLMDMELEDLNAVDIREADQALRISGRDPGRIGRRDRGYEISGEFIGRGQDGGRTT